MPPKVEPVYTTVDHILSPSLLLSSNTSKEPSLSSSDTFSVIPSELGYIRPSIGPNMVHSVMPSIDYENTSIDASSLQPSSSTSLE